MMTYAVRALRRSKGFGLLAVVSLGLAISLTTLVFGVFDAMINPTLAIRAPDELWRAAYRGDLRRQISASTYNARVAAMTSISGAAGASLEARQFVTRGGETRAVRVLMITPNYFALLGIRALHGRLLGDNDAVSSERPVVVSERMWAKWFAGTTWVPGATILLNGDPRPIVGILPLESDFPGANTDIWQQESSSRPLLRTLLRRRSEATLTALDAELKVVAAQLAHAANESPSTTWFTVKPAVGKPFEPFGFHFALASSAAAVFLVTCLNLANLQLARGVRRSRELATISAIGAARHQLILLLMQEVALVAFGGLVAGAWFAALGARLVRFAIPPMFGDLLVRPQLSWRVFAFAAAASLLACLVVGLAPAIRLSRPDLQQALKAGSRAFRTYESWITGLLVAQVSLALGVVLFAGLLSRTVLRLNTFDLGEDVKRVVYATMTVTPRVGTHRKSVDVLADLRSQLQSEPLASDVATAVAVNPVRHSVAIAMPGKAPTDVDVGSAYFLLVSPNYLRTFGTPIVAGRDFEEGEASRSVIVDRSTAAWLWPVTSAIGREMKFGDARSNAPWFRVVGVAADIPQPLNADMGEARYSGVRRMYVAAGGDTTHLTGSIGVMVLARAVAVDSAPHLRNVLERHLRDFGQEVDGVHAGPWGTVQYLEDMRTRQGFVASIFAIFGGIALLIAALGVYATVSQRVGLRSRELAIRMALGADERVVRGLVRTEASVIVLIGIGLGLVLGALSVSWLSAFVRSASDRYDPLAYGVVGVLVFATTTAASFWPIRRAAPKNLTKALGSE